MNTLASTPWRTWWVVSRRSLERCMPPCSAMARKRLATRHCVSQGPIHSRYSSGRPATVKTATMASCAPRIDHATRRLARLRVPRSRPFRIFQPEMPTASRTSLRRNESRVMG